MGGPNDLAKLASVKARLCRSFFIVSFDSSAGRFLSVPRAGRTAASSGDPFCLTFHQGSLDITPVPKSGVCLQPRPHFCSLMTLAFFCYCTGLSSQCLSVCPALPGQNQPAKAPAGAHSVATAVTRKDGRCRLTGQTEQKTSGGLLCSAPLSEPPGCPSMCH